MISSKTPLTRALPSNNDFSSPSRQNPRSDHYHEPIATMLFRKRGGASQDGKQVDELLQQDAPLDEHEQESIVQEFEEMQLQNTRLWRHTFGAGPVPMSGDARSPESEWLGVASPSLSS
jgi:hypothetical protein